MEKPHISLHLIHRLADHLESCNTFSLKKIKFLVLDEADRLLAGGGGFDEQVCVPQSCPLFKCYFFAAKYTQSSPKCSEL